MTSLLMSSPPISISHRYCKLPFLFPAPPPERPRQAIADMASMFISSSSCKCKEETLLFSVACIITMRLLDSLRKKKKRISMYERYLFTFPKADRRKVSSSFNLFHRQIFYQKNSTNWKDPKRQIERYVSFTPDEHYLIIHSVDCLQSFLFFRVRMGSCRSTRETPSVTRAVIFVSCAFCSTS